MTQLASPGANLLNRGPHAAINRQSPAPLFTQSNRRNLSHKISPTELKIKMTAPPVEGKANEMLIKLLAKHFGVRKSQVTIVSGAQSRQKVVEITNP